MSNSRHQHYQSPRPLLQPLQQTPHKEQSLDPPPLLPSLVSKSSPPQAAAKQSKSVELTYETILNSTLLFFVEKLIERSPRTLHDLSCQFGSPYFTREMRAIAGNSQAGLKKFLQSHPYVFMINPDDTVAYSPIFSSSSDKDSSVSSSEISSTSDAPLDKDTLQAIEYFQKRLLQYGSNIRVPIKSLQGHRSQAPQVIRHIVGQQLDQFVQFLKKHDSVFVVENELVWLVSASAGDSGADYGVFKELDPPVQIDTEKINQLIKFVQSTIENQGPMLVEQLFHSISVQFEGSEQMFKTPTDLATFLRMQNVFQVHSNLVTLTFIQQSPTSANPKIMETRDKEYNQVNKLINNDSKHQQEALILANNPKSPSKRSSQATSVKSGGGGESSFTTTTTANAPSQPRQQQLVPSRKIQRNLVNNVILQTINANTTVLPSDNIALITNSRKASQIIQTHLLSATSIGLDCEGVNLGPDGQITLIQIGTQANHIYIFDMLVDGMNDLLKPVLESQSIVKVMHDCRNDSVNLCNQYGINLVNVFDTQVAYMLTKSKSQNISLNALCSELELDGNVLKDKVKSIYRYDPKYWLRRPLTKEMLNYASSDVTSLLQIYSKLLPLLPDLDTFNDLCLEQINALIEPNEIKQKKRLRKNQVDVEKLRNTFEKCTNFAGLVLSNREIRLIKHLNLPQETIQQLPLKIYKKLTNKSQSPTNQQTSGYCGGLNNNSDNEHEHEQPSSLEPCSLDSLISTIDLFMEKNKISSVVDGSTNNAENAASITITPVSKDGANKKSTTTREISTQTLSTGDIVLSKVYNEEEIGN